MLNFKDLVMNALKGKKQQAPIQKPMPVNLALALSNVELSRTALKNLSMKQSHGCYGQSKIFMRRGRAGRWKEGLLHDKSGKLLK
jgi:hypothetical protein